jgi:ABC-type lipoprotein export system ATPase subunit
MKNEAMIEMRDVVKKFKNAAGEFIVLKGIDLTLNKGEFISIVGKSGSGKSTLLNMLTGIDHPTSGKVIIGGVDVYALTESERSLWRGRNLGIVFQFFQLLPMLTLQENVMLPMDYVNAYDEADRPQRALELLDMVGLAKQAHKLPAAVSTGQQQAAAIARAMATNPPIIVADEPTGNLDSRSADAIIEVFEKLVLQGKTIVMVTHDPSMTERTSRNIIISDGELIDETIAKAMPLLTHKQMMKATKLAERIIVQPGATIIRRDQPVDQFFMIASGNVDVLLQNGKGREDVIASTMTAGQFFGDVELTRTGKAIANVRAANDGTVELIALKREAFDELLRESPLTADALGRIVQRKLEENRASDQRGFFAKLFGGR